MLHDSPLIDLTLRGWKCSSCWKSLVSASPLSKGEESSLPSAAVLTVNPMVNNDNQRLPPSAAYKLNFASKIQGWSLGNFAFPFLVSVPKHLSNQGVGYVYLHCILTKTISSKCWQTFNLLHGSCRTMFCFSPSDKCLEQTGLSSSKVSVNFLHPSTVSQLLRVKGKVNLLNF